jgi:hypothetical protein
MTALGSWDNMEGSFRLQKPDWGIEPNALTIATSEIAIYKEGQNAMSAPLVIGLGFISSASYGG